MCDKVPQATRVHRPDLFDQYASPLPLNHDFRPERSEAGALRRGSHQNDGSGEERICLDDDPEAGTLLLMPHSLRHSQLVDVTPAHGGSP